MAVVRLVDPAEKMDLDELRVHLGDRLAPYKHPRELHVVDHIPRNHLGKVNKKTLLTALGLDKQ